MAGRGFRSVPRMGDGAVTHVTVSEVAGLVASGALFVDVREHQETTLGHAPGTTMMPMQSFNLNALPPDVPLVFICRSGHRSDAVATALAGMGYTTYNVLGGMIAWQAAGLPVLTDAGEPGMVM